MHLGNGACQGGFSEIFGSLCRPPLCRPWDSVRAQTGLLEFPRAQKRPDYSPSKGVGSGSSKSEQNSGRREGSDLEMARVLGPERTEFRF